MNSKEQIELLEDEVDMLKKEVTRRDIVIANLARQHESHKRIRSQVRALLRSINNEILDYFIRMKDRKIIDCSQEADSAISDVYLHKIDDKLEILEAIKLHDLISDTPLREPYTFKTVVGEIGYFVYDKSRSVVKFLVFLPLRTIKKLRRPHQ